MPLRPNMYARSIIALLALSAATCGCGTMANMYTTTGNVPPRPFGGIATDLEAIARGDVLGIVDLPGSLVGDVVTLPDVLVANAHQKRASEPQDHELRPADSSDPPPDRADD